jgi:hypothetical protein
LESEECSVGREDEVQSANSNDGVVGVLDDSLEDAVLGGSEGCVAAGGVGVAETKDIVACALVPSAVYGSV